MLRRVEIQYFTAADMLGAMHLTLRRHPNDLWLRHHMARWLLIRQQAEATGNRAFFVAETIH